MKFRIKKENKEDVLNKNNIRVSLKSTDKYEAIKMAGTLLVQDGYVSEEYIQAMIKREEDLTTYIGNGVAIPHGIGEAKKYIKKSGIVILQFPNGIQFEDGIAYLIIGIAGVGDDHISILSNIATIIGEENTEVLKKIYSTDDVDFLYRKFTVMT